MTRFLLDTNHAGSLFHDQPRLWNRIALANDAESALCRPSIGELWFMVLNSSRQQENQLKLEQLLQNLIVWEFDAVAAQEYGRIRVELRRAGKPIPAIDAQIAAIARCQSAIVLTSDGHFSAVPALQSENWLM